MFPSTPREIYYAEHCVDFRKRFDGLLSECYRMGLDPYRGIGVLFIKKDRGQLRFLFGDDRGLFLVCRRFDGGSLKDQFRFVREPTCREISVGELSLLMEGSSYVVKRRVKAWRDKKND